MARGGRPYSTEERRAILAGEFFTQAELRAKPWLGKTVLADAARQQPGYRVDPNTRPMTAKDRAAIDAMIQVCAYCREPGDDRSALDARSYHPECAEAWAAEVAARKNGK